MNDMRTKHQDELAGLEGQVKEALQVKDAFLEGLQQKLSEKTAELHAMNELLCHQHQSLDAA